MNELQKRTLSAIILAPLVLAAIIVGGYVFLALIFLILILATQEWWKLSLKTSKPAQFLFFGFCYLPIALFSFTYIRIELGMGLTIVMLLAIWASDIGAYFTGKKLGKHKMAPAISPNKSWEGLLGGMLFSAVIMNGYIFFDQPADWVTYEKISSGLAGHGPGILVLTLFGMGIAFVGQLGDLLESFLKRKAGAKDSGNIIPGHGGILDRIDSILLVSPFFVLISKYVL